MPILVCGLSSERPVQLLLEALKKKGAYFLVLNQPDLAKEVRVRWKLTSQGIFGHMQVGADIIDIREIKGVFQRLMGIEQISELIDDRKSIHKTRSILHTLMDLFDILPAKIVNQRRAMMSNSSKPFQSLLIREAGFSIPETLVTNIPAEAQRFINKHKLVIYKSTSSIRSIVKTIDRHDIQRLEKMHCLPTQLQNKIKGFNVRVHVVGEKIFATRIHTRATDYRYAYLEHEDMQMQPYKLTETLNKMCIDLTKRLGLLFAGIDLMITDKKAYCLEVNTSPGYSFYEEQTGQPIAAALAQLLSA